MVQDWKFVAQVLDRMFLWAFLLVSILGSALLFIPVIYKWASIIVPNHETMVFGNWKTLRKRAFSPEKSILGFQSKYYMKLWETSHISPTLQYISVWCFHLLTGFTGSLSFFDFVRDSMKLKINVPTRYSFGVIYYSHTFMNSSFSQFL